MPDHCCPNWTTLKFRSLVIAAEIRGQRRDLKTRAHVCRPDGSLMQGLSIFARTGSPPLENGGQGGFRRFMRLIGFSAGRLRRFDRRNPPQSAFFKGGGLRLRCGPCWVRTDCQILIWTRVMPDQVRHDKSIMRLFIRTDTYPKTSRSRVRPPGIESTCLREDAAGHGLVSATSVTHGWRWMRYPSVGTGAESKALQRAGLGSRSSTATLASGNAMKERRSPRHATKVLA
jgi:hypothetical protein